MHNLGSFASKRKKNRLRDICLRQNVYKKIFKKLNMEFIDLSQSILLFNGPYSIKNNGQSHFKDIIYDKFGAI